MGLIVIGPEPPPQVYIGMDGDHSVVFPSLHVPISYEPPRFRREVNRRTEEHDVFSARK